jgi:hypothetical protein
MKNLENKDILPDKIMDAIKIIISNSPNFVFGGSIALNAVGLINREIKDIDLFFGLDESLQKNGFLTYISDGITSDTVTDVNGNDIQRTGAKINNVNVCCFKVSQEELSHSKYHFNRDGISYVINIQNVNYAIIAKKTYQSRNKKHYDDLINIFNELANLF